MRVRVIRIIEMIGEESKIDLVLRKSFLDPGKEYSVGQYSVKEIVRLKENYKGEGSDDNQGV